MGYDVQRFQSAVDEELICPICTGVLQEPLQAPKCEHTFCEECIKEWLSRQPSCPVDRLFITTTDLKPVPRIIRNLLYRLKIQCENASLGCREVLQLDRAAAHYLECDFNPKKKVPCEQGCGLIIPKDELKDHNCIRELRTMYQSQQEEIFELQSQLTEQRREFLLMKTSISECVRALLHTNAAEFGNPRIEDEAILWSNSLQRARVTRWGGMISTPDSVLQAVVRRALFESNCPVSIIDKLMENAHERNWPPGLNTLETRQANRRSYENYVCKRIPGKQAVVVMLVDNMHMDSSMVLEPGLVMVFAHGIE